MLDAVLGELYPDEQALDVRQLARPAEAVARANWDFFVRHPWAAHLATGRPPLGPNLMRKYELELRAVDGLGLSEVQMDLLVTLVNGFVRGTVERRAREGRRRAGHRRSPRTSGGRRPSPTSPRSSTPTASPRPPGSARSPARSCGAVDPRAVLRVRPRAAARRDRRPDPQPLPLTSGHLAAPDASTATSENRQSTSPRDWHARPREPPPLDPERCYRAVAGRDARFDGWFFTAVRTTGIYCRPSCPARTPLARNVSFFTTAAAAQGAGYRACRRCRPDAVPGLARVGRPRRRRRPRHAADRRRRGRALRRPRAGRAAGLLRAAAAPAAGRRARGRRRSRSPGRSARRPRGC